MKRKAKYTRKIKKEGNWWSFWVMTRQGNYKRSFSTRSEARKERWSLESDLMKRLK